MVCNNLLVSELWFGMLAVSLIAFSVEFKRRLGIMSGYSL